MSESDSNNGDAAPLLAVFLDFDGTLVEIADTPDAVSVSPELNDRLSRAVNDFGSALAVVSGREIADIDHFLSPLKLPVAGAHGSQRRRADGSMVGLDAATLAAARDIATSVGPLAESHEGILVEAKDGAVAVHFRKAPALEEACRFAMEQAVSIHPEFTLVPGKMVIEARPSGFDKGGAVRAFMSEAPFAGRTPIFIGDDRTDEDGFRAAQELGGFGIKIGPGETAARMRVADVPAAHELLRGLGQIATVGSIAGLASARPGAP